MSQRAAAVFAATAIMLSGCGSTFTRTVTVRAAAPPPVVKTVTKWRTKVVVKHEPVTTTPTTPVKPSGLYGAQSRAENEEAGCMYGFTGSGSTVKCNTQTEGQRIQEVERQRRDDGQAAHEEAEETARRVYQQEQCQAAGTPC